MRHRKRAPRKQDKKVFNQTARRTKKINLAPRIMRGGIRL